MSETSDRAPAANIVAAEWDTRYSSTNQLSSGQPNAVLIAEVGGLEPGRALEIGCGEGADAVWLAAHGWTVTALDVSQVALDRAALRAQDAAVTVEWVRAGLVDADLPAGGFDLVCAQYPALRRSPGDEAEAALLAAVASGGILLVVHHADVDPEVAKSHGFDIEDYVSHADLVGFLGEEWDVRNDERRPREVPTGAVVPHTHDDVLWAQRRR